MRTRTFQPRSMRLEVPATVQAFPPFIPFTNPFDTRMTSCRMKFRWLAGKGHEGTDPDQNSREIPMPQ